MSALQPALRAASIEDVQSAVLAGDGPLLARGGGTKPALSATATAAPLDLSGLRGIVEYDPGEYTFTAKAGTSLETVQHALAEHGQYLPFDPPLAAAGATLGGTVAAGLSGAGRMRYGGVRDFLIGVRFVDGQGRLVRGGGKVVKNAAGFDLTKLLIGSLGRLGILVEVSFKVFPAPKNYATIRTTLPTLADAVATAQKLARASFDLEALDFAPTPDEAGKATLWARLGGLPDTLPQRIAGLINLLDGGEIMTDEEEAAHWSDVRSLAMAGPDAALAKAAVTPGQVLGLDEGLADGAALRHYSVGGNLAWIAWPGSVADLDDQLKARKLSGLILAGAAERPLIGYQPGGALLARVKQTLDPAGRFPVIIPEREVRN